MSEEAPYKVGETVSLARWDRTEPKKKRLGDSEVISVKSAFGCESGWLIEVKSKSTGSTCTLDANWLSKSLF